MPKALFFAADRPYSDFGDLLQIARAEASRILKTKKVKILNILPCNYPLGYVAVVQSSGGMSKNVDLKGET